MRTESLVQAPCDLTRAECTELLRSQSIGRVAYTDGALPQVLPVNYVMDGSSVVIRTTPTGRLATCCTGAVVAFEVDMFDAGSRTGRSVVVVGDVNAVTDESELVRLRQLPFAPWAAGQRDHYLRITPGIVTGRAVG